MPASRASIHDDALAFVGDAATSDEIQAPEETEDQIHDEIHDADTRCR